MARDEGDGVARLLAAEAVVEALLGVDAERRRLLGVERAQPDQRRPTFLSAACSLISATMSVAARTWATSSSGMPTTRRYRGACRAARPSGRWLYGGPTFGSPGRGAGSSSWPSPSAVALSAAGLGLALRRRPRRPAGGVGATLGQDGLRRGQAGHRDPEGRAADVVEPGVVEEADRLGVPPVLAADPDLEARLVERPRSVPRRTSSPTPSKSTDVEGVARQEAELEVGVHHAALDVVAGEPEGHLRQVVGPEGEEVGHLGDLGGPQGGAGRLDHGPDGHLELAPRRAALAPLGARCGLLVDVGHGVFDPAPGQRQLGAGHGQGDHDLDDRVPAVGHPLAGRLHEGPHLHGVEAGLDHPRRTPRVPEHGVGLPPRQRRLVHAALLGVQPDGVLLDGPAPRSRARTRAAAGRAGAR